MNTILFRTVDLYGLPFELKEHIAFLSFFCIVLLSKLRFKNVLMIINPLWSNLCSMNIFLVLWIIYNIKVICACLPVTDFLSLRIITFSFSFHLNYFDLPSNFFSFICFFLHLCWLECLGCMANPCTCANALSCGRTGPQCQQMKATRGSWAGTHHLLSCRCGLLFYGGN